jgi:SPP1 gp7 family putative phage head morphogenesis protein
VRTIGKPLSLNAERALLVVLRPMIADVKATLKSVKTAKDATALGVALRKKWSDKKIAELLAKVGTKIEREASKPWSIFARPRRDGKRFDARVYDGAKLLEQWSKNANKLITSVRDEVAERMRRDVVEAIANGVDPATLAARWAADGIPVLHGTLEGRVKVIAQHQIRMLDAEVQRTRAGSVGVSEFVWRSQGDDKVRDLHRALDGRVFKYEDPSTSGEGLPGQPINCRCWAESVVPDDLAAAVGLSRVFEGTRENSS